MDGNVETVLGDMVATASAEAIGKMTDYIPTAGIILVTVGVLFFGIKIFRAIAHV